MHVLLIHNRYQQPGGEDAVFENEKALLEAHGHTIECYQRSNDELAGLGPTGRLRAAAATLWSRRSYQDLIAVIERFRPAVAHFTNTFPLVSPSAYYACHRRGVAVVQTVQNYRLVCPSGVLLRDGAICEDCVGRSFAWPGIRHRCYRNSAAQSATVAAMLWSHRQLKTWSRRVDLYVSATEFSRAKLAEGGIPADRIRVKPNFLNRDPGADGRAAQGDYALFVGRLAPVKGLRTLLDAWRGLPDIPLHIAGGGPMLESLSREVESEEMRHVRLLGYLPNSDIPDLMRNARFLVFPSEWYEGFPVTIVEAFACGLPVLASRLGGMAEVVDEGATGRHFVPGNADDLREQARALWQDHAATQGMGQEARAVFESRYTAERNYEILSAIYEEAIQRRKQANP